MARGRRRKPIEVLAGYGMTRALGWSGPVVRLRLGQVRRIRREHLKSCPVNERLMTKQSRCQPDQKWAETQSSLFCHSVHQKFHSLNVPALPIRDAA